jgi:hypothetical protein
MYYYGYLTENKQYTKITLGYYQDEPAEIAETAVAILV